MKLLFVTPFYRPAYIYGGPTRSIPSLCEGLVQQGHKVEVFTTNANGPEKLDVPLETAVDVNGVEVAYFDQSTIGGRFFYAPDLKRACRRRAPDFDVTYIYGIWNYPAIAAGSACRKQDAPYIVSPRTGLMKWPMQQRWLRKQVFLRLFGWRYLHGAWAMHYTTDIEKQEAEQFGVRTPGFVVPNCMDFSEFDQLPETGGFRSRLGVSPETRLVLFLGRIEPRKGVDLSMRAFAQVRKSVPDCHFAIAGPGDEGYVDQLSELSIDLGIQDATTFTGYVDSTERIGALVDADVFILTSHTENFAMAAVEAMAAETPILLSDEVGVAPAADKAEAGLSVSLSEDVIAEALNRLLSSSSLRESLAQNGPTHARSQYSPTSVADQMIAAIEARQRTESS
jgi:glycosyltransferase involved in cell wall biosynthesis